MAPLARDWIWDLARETLTPLTLDDASYPVWTPDGRRVVFASWRLRDAQNLFSRTADGAGTVDQELFYLDGRDLLTVVAAQASSATFSSAKPVRLLNTNYGSPDIRRTYDVSVDGQRFLMLKESGDPNLTPAKIVVVLNWHEELKAKLPAK